MLTETVYKCFSVVAGVCVKKVKEGKVEVQLVAGLHICKAFHTHTHIYIVYEGTWVVIVLGF